ncbi:MAG TPA: DUF2934 domain-containing protein [Terriglobales bacterium]|nr:DUF2934 domain-containing protein [Terriglobales bacterium]
MADEIKKLGADLAEIEKGIRELSKQPHPNQKRMEFWTREAVKLREQIATISGEDNGARYSPLKPKPSTLAPKSHEPTLLIPIEQKIQQRAYELYERSGRTDGHDLYDWLQAECEIKGTQANAQRYSLRQSSRAVGGSAGLVVSALAVG